MTERKQLLLRLDPAVHDAVARWAADDLRSVNAQIEVLLRNELKRAGRPPDAVKPLPRRGRPPRGERADCKRRAAPKRPCGCRRPPAEFDVDRQHPGVLGCVEGDDLGHLRVRLPNLGHEPGLQRPAQTLAPVRCDDCGVQLPGRRLTQGHRRLRDACGLAVHRQRQNGDQFASGCGLLGIVGRHSRGGEGLRHVTGLPRGRVGHRCCVQRSDLTQLLGRGGTQPGHQFVAVRHFGRGDHLARVDRRDAIDLRQSRGGTHQPLRDGVPSDRPGTCRRVQLLVTFLVQRPDQHRLAPQFTRELLAKTHARRQHGGNICVRVHPDVAIRRTVGDQAGLQFDRGDVAVPVADQHPAVHDVGHLVRGGHLQFLRTPGQGVTQTTLPADCTGYGCGTRGQFVELGAGDEGA